MCVCAGDASTSVCLRQDVSLAVFEKGSELCVCVCVCVSNVYQLSNLHTEMWRTDGLACHLQGYMRHYTPSTLCSLKVLRDAQSKQQYCPVHFLNN